MLHCESAGLPVVAHVHDEVILEVPHEQAEEALHRLVAIMVTPPKWATGFPIVVFGVLPLPDFVPVDRTLALALRPWHEWLSWAMAALVAAHVAAALKHHWVDRDGILSRMWPAKA